MKTDKGCGVYPPGSREKPDILESPLVRITGASMVLDPLAVPLSPYTPSPPPPLNSASRTALECSVPPAALSALACHDTRLSWLFFLSASVAPAHPTDLAQSRTQVGC